MIRFLDNGSNSQAYTAPVTVLQARHKHTKTFKPEEQVARAKAVDSKTKERPHEARKTRKPPKPLPNWQNLYEEKLYKEACAAAITRKYKALHKSPKTAVRHMTDAELESRRKANAQKQAQREQAMFARLESLSQTIRDEQKKAKAQYRHIARRPLLKSGWIAKEGSDKSKAVRTAPKKPVRAKSNNA
jgi:hypothetical protein